MRYLTSPFRPSPRSIFLHCTMPCPVLSSRLFVCLTAPCSPTPLYTLPPFPTLHCIALYCIALHYIVQYCAVLYQTYYHSLFNSSVHCTILHLHSSPYYTLTPPTPHHTPPFTVPYCRCGGTVHEQDPFCASCSRPHKTRWKYSTVVYSRAEWRRIE